MIDGKRIRALRELKGLRTQQALAELVDVPQSHICDLENGKLRNVKVFLKIADRLDCTTDFLFRRGPFASLREEADLKAAASQMAFDAFAARPAVDPEQFERCRRVLGHHAAPISAESWQDLADQIDLATGRPGGPTLRRIQGGWKS